MCGSSGHTPEGLQNIIKLLYDCRHVIVARIGVWIVSELKQNGIKPIEFFGSVEEALKLVNT
jgi:hypothetical protein